MRDARLSSADKVLPVGATVDGQNARNGADHIATSPEVTLGAEVGAIAVTRIGLVNRDGRVRDRNARDASSIRRDGEDRSTSH